MSFTREQIKEIKEKLALLGSKDNNLPVADLPLEGNETIAIIQDGNNRKVSIDNFYSQFEEHINKSKVDFFNVSVYAMRISEAPEITYYTLDEAILLCPDEVKKSGQVITFLDKNDNWQIWQFTSSDPTNWDNVNEYWKNLEDKIGLGIIFTSSKQNIEYNNPEDFEFHFETIDGGKVSSAILYKTDYSDINRYNKEVEVNDISSYDFTVYNLTTTTKVKIVATQYGETYEKEITLPFVRPAWIGPGENSSSIRNGDEHKFYVSDNAKNAYDITFDELSYLIITLPKNVILDPVTMNGFEVPLQEQVSSETIGGIAYRTYKSTNKYIPGVHRFVIGVYSGSEHELMSSVLASLNGLNELISNNNEVDIEQSNSIRDIESRVETLENESYNTADQEDLMVTYDHKYKFADKEFDKDNFSGKGRVYLRKNVQDIEFTQQNDPTITDPNTTITRRMNILTTNMIYNDDTTYIVQYDYDLQDNTFYMPLGSGLQYAGGTFNNGILDVTGCILLPGWENIIGENFTITGIPAVGSMYFNTEANTLYVSNGTNWFKMSGEIIYNENDLNHANDELDDEQDENQNNEQNNEDTPI